MKKKIYSLLPLLLICLQSMATSIDYDTYSESVYGGIGLIETPTARFSNDGEFLFGVSTDSPNNRIYSKVQFLPWMEAVLRYTEGTFKPYYDGSQQTWKDKGLDIKFKLLDESKSRPQIAFGIRDLGGTGRYSSEYLVTSKNFGFFDLTLGLGWGKLDGKKDISNPLKWVRPSGRGGTQEGFGGRLNLDNYFSGPTASFFGGMQIYTPIPLEAPVTSAILFFSIFNLYYRL